MLKKFFNSLRGIKEDANNNEDIENKQDIQNEDSENADNLSDEDTDRISDEDPEKNSDIDEESAEEDADAYIMAETPMQEPAESDISIDTVIDIEEAAMAELIEEEQVDPQTDGGKIEMIQEADSISQIEAGLSAEPDKEGSQETIDDAEENKVDSPEPSQKPAMGLFARLKQGLEKTTQNLTGRLDELFKGHIEIDDDLYEEIEEILITGDVGFETTLKIIDNLKTNIKKKSIQNTAQVRDELKNVIEELMTLDNGSLNVENPPVILVIIGVNGVGKTTSIGKLALRLKNEGKSVLLAAADTFRAAAAEQLEVWAKRADVDIIMHQEGSDPSAVIFDAIKSAKSKKTDVLICDTAGRLHNKKNLMQELSKIFRIIDREYPEAAKEVLIVIDATTGQNAISQVKLFKEAAPVTGVILTKLDGTAKGGVVLSIASEQQLPIKLIGVGEKIEDLQDFDPKDFAEALFSKQD